MIDRHPGLNALGYRISPRSGLCGDFVAFKKIGINFILRFNRRVSLICECGWQAKTTVWRKPDAPKRLSDEFRTETS
jgi:hypothetical protein